MAQKILVVGNGGREHAICRALATARPAPRLWVAPGNGGTCELGENLPLLATDVEGLVAFARRETVDLVVPGPEAALCAGLADALLAAGIPCCGPSRLAAELESSKRFMRELTEAAGVPGARFTPVCTAADLERALAEWPEVPVLKADGLAAGKGVFLPDTREEACAIGRELLAGRLGQAGRCLVLEERLQGVEASLFYACDGERALALPHARDHKRVSDGDAGPNTGGMGAVSPNPTVTPAIEEQVRREIVTPTLRAMREAGRPFVGFLFAGVMLTDRGPRLLEFNVRLGDPEAQAILPRLAPGCFAEVCAAVAAGRLADVKVEELAQVTCAVVLAAAGYPEVPSTGASISVTAELAHAQRWLDHAGTKQQGDSLVTAGGRVAAVVARADTADEARALAYDGVGRVRFDGMHYRRDIGA